VKKGKDLRVSLILSAMPSEICGIDDRIANLETGNLSCFHYKTGELSGRKVITAVTGVGVTLAAANDK